MTGQHDAAAAELLHADIEGDTRARRGFLENEREHLAGQRRVLVLGATRQTVARFLALARCGDQCLQRTGLEIAQIEKVPWRRIHGFARLSGPDTHTAFLSRSKLAQVSPSATIASLTWRS